MLLFFSLRPAAAQESLRIAATPAVSIPLGASSDLFTMGLGGEVDLLLPIGTAGTEGMVEIGYTNVLLDAGAGSLHLLQAAGGIRYPIFKRAAFVARLQAGAGAYVAFFEGTTPMANPSFFAGLSAELTIGRGFTIAVTPQYEQLLTFRSGSMASFYSAAGIRVSLAAEPGKVRATGKAPKLKILPPSFDRVFPVIYKYYDANPIGSVTLRNDERGVIRDIQVAFFVPRYMDGPKLVAEFSEMKPKEEREVPLTALFRNSILEITEIDSVQAQVAVGYTFGKDTLTAQRNDTVRIANRNTITWDDDRKAAAFVTANDPTVSKISRNVVATIGDLGSTAVNEKLSQAMAIFSALQLYGIRYVIDPNSAYQVLSQDQQTPDYLQFPVQTLDYRSGDCDDLSILYTAMLEAVGIESAFITVPGHIFSALALDITQEEARRTFSSTSDLIFHDGNTWVPVETTLLSRGFMQAWADGARQWREATAQGNAGFFPVREAWSVYEPTWFGSTEAQSVVERFPQAQAVAAGYTSEANKFVSRELAPQISDLQARIAARPSPVLINRLGTVYARYGILDKAEAAFREAANGNYMPAIHNLGNLAYLRGDHRQALAYYERAYKLNPDNADVVLSLAKVRYELEQFAIAQQMYDVAVILDPAKAKGFAYIKGTGAEAGRAADAQKRSAVIWFE